MADFIPIDFTLHKSALIELNLEYMDWVFSQFREHLGVDPKFVVGSLREYVEKVIREIFSYTPPDGICYLIREGETVVGMAALRKLKEGVCEIKRMYVRSDYRGKGLGRSILEQLLEDAKKFGFSMVYLDTAPFMKAAQNLYRSIGFTKREMYPETEVPEEHRHLWVYMEKKI